MALCDSVFSSANETNQGAYVDVIAYNVFVDRAWICLEQNVVQILLLDDPYRGHYCGNFLLHILSGIPDGK